MVYLRLCAIVLSVTLPTRGWTGVASTDWRLTHMTAREGALVSVGQEASATLGRTIEAPAVRVTYDATMVAADATGKFSDLSCFVGDAFFKFGGGYNSVTQINAGSQAGADLSPRITLGKTYRVVAEVNGRAARLTIDGREVGALLLAKAAAEKKVTLYNWSGRARFENVRIEIKATADPVPDELLKEEAYGAQTPQTLKHLRDWPLPQLTPGKAGAAGVTDIPLTVDFGAAAQVGMQWPITRGVPLPRGALFDPDRAMVVDEAGNEVPSQRTVTATWSEKGSIRWLLLDFVLVVTEKAPTLFLRYGQDVLASKVGDGVKVTDAAQSITLDSGVAAFTISKARGTVLESATLGGRPILGRAEAYYDTKQGWRYTTNNAEELDVKVEMAGPIRSVVRSRGWYADDAGRRACYFTRRLYVYKGLPWARLFTTWTVTVDTRAYTFTDVGVRFNLASPTEQPPLTILAADRNEGYVITEGNRLRTADAPQDISSSGASIGCFEMTRQWPAALEATGDAITFHGFSNLAGLNLDMTDGGLRKLWGSDYDRFNAGRNSYPAIADRNPNGCGFAKTHELLIALHEPAAPPRDVLDAFQEPVMVASDPAHNCATGVVGPGEYHPLDRKNFPKVEAAIEKQRDELLSALDRVEPWYGFWDYGAGVPHHMRGDVKGNGRITYSGYRRCYDMGYQQPMVPWMMHLRSGQRAWLDFAVRNARCMMDARFFHWTNQAAGKQLGHFVQDHGTWAWDNYLAGFAFNCYMPTLLLDYYTTGYERAMDVHTEVMDAYCRTGRSYYVASIGVWLGNTAAAYRATWEPRYREAFEKNQKNLLASVCGLCGGVHANPTVKDEQHDHHGVIHRNGWVEYGIVEAMQVDDHDPELEQILVRNGRERYVTKGHSPYAMMAWSRLVAYRAIKDKRIAREARDVFDHYMTEGHGTLLELSGLSYLRAIPVLMRMAKEARLDEIALPIKTRLPTPVVIQHTQGSATNVFFFTRQKIAREKTGLKLLGPDGEEVTDGRAAFDPILGRLTLKVGADEPTGIYTLRGLEPTVYESDTPFGVWVSHLPDTRLAVAISEGYHHHSASQAPKLWFRVPSGTKRFRIRNNVETRVLTITRPDGWTHRASGAWHTLDVPADLPDWPWSVESTADDYVNFQCIKLYDVPALVSPSRDAVFAMDDAPRTGADHESATFDSPFAPGVLGKALHLDGRDRLRIDLGEITDSHSRERFSTRRGTVEFFFMLNTNPFFARAAGFPFEVRVDESATFKNWSRNWLTMTWKNAVVMLTPDGRQLSRNRFGPWDTNVGMIKLRAGKWYHLAIVWDADKALDVHGKTEAKTHLRVFVDGQQISHGVYDHPQWFADGHDAPLPAKMLEMISRNHDVLIDELRVSDVERLGYDGPGSDHTYPAPTKAYMVDKHTRLLMHFDGTLAVESVGVAGSKAEFVDSR